MAYEKPVILPETVQPQSEQRAELHDLEVTRLTPRIETRMAATTAAPETWQRLSIITDELFRHSKKHYAHSLRVALYTHDLAVAEGQPGVESGDYLAAGLGHDVGKVAVDTAILEATQGLTDEQFKRQAIHPKVGFLMLRQTSLKLALVAGMHHLYRKNGYGIDIAKDKDIPTDLDPKVIADAIATAKLLMIADSFDAAVTRRDGRSKASFGNMEGKRRELVEAFPEEVERIDWLFAHRLPPTPSLDLSAKRIGRQLITAQ
ncbi:MAG: HD domain-containing protein [Candidatus Saccharimonadales bacterium]